jgi:hypothetical protein
MVVELKLKTLAEHWSGVPASERANFQSYLIQLCDALGVEAPRPAGTGYEFEYPVRVVNRDGSESVNFIDLYKQDHFVLEAKHQEANKPDSQLLHGAYGQARAYAASVPGAPPPYLMVLDVGRVLLVWDRWSGTYGGFQAARRIDLNKLADRPEDISLLQDIFERPAARDPRGRAEAVTREIAERLAQVASSLEERAHEPEQVARFLMRCVFSMFAEDVGLLPGEPFTNAIEEIGFKDPDEFSTALEHLWEAMDRGERFGLRKFLRFNGHFFKDTTVLSLTKADLAILHEASKADWRDVEPSIMGTLLNRALDPEERHKLGAEYTPREYVERLVRPTVEEPLRERWTAVQADVLQLLDPEGKAERTRKQHQKDALARLRAFHEWLRGLRFLDPACGSGNFLYVTLSIVKQIELEVLRSIEGITGAPELAVEEVGPWQFHGIEVKAWAREIAELTLWIGYHQWWRRTHGHTLPPEPVLRDTGTLEHRDAVLVWEAITEDPERARPDPTPRIRHGVTGELVPDPEAKLPYEQYENPRKAPWPEADFIVGNPPYMGRGRQREAFGDGYVDALRSVYPEVPDNADFVMYWWSRAAQEVAAGRSIRAGLITTNTITQRHNRQVVEQADGNGVSIIWAAPDHPWVDEVGSAAVRVALTVLAPSSRGATLVRVSDDGREVRETAVDRLNADLTAHADVAGAARTGLLANRGLSSQGFTLVGEGFRLPSEEGGALLILDRRHERIVRPLRNGRDLTQRPRGLYTIDFGLMSEAEAKEYPVLYDLVRDRVRPARSANKRDSYARYWWRFGETRSGLRSALRGLPRYIATVETAKHRTFHFLSAEVAAEHSVVCIALDDLYYLGVLSSTIHVAWALAAGGRLGVGNDPRYQKALCFDPFPLPEGDPEARSHIRDVAERIERHRVQAMERDEVVTTTGMYNVVEALRAGVELTPKEQEIHRVAACGTLRDLHDELDALVAEAYGWEWPLEGDEILARLVALHATRIAEEAAGVIRWLRPDFQRLHFGSEREAAELEFEKQGEPEAVVRTTAWPSSTIEQIRALQALLASGACTVEEAARHFTGARRDIVARHLETLALMGEARLGPDGAYHVLNAAA